MAKATTKSDAAIQRDVLKELEWDGRVEQTDVGVEVDEGIVTLTGAVESYSERIAAQKAAHRVKDVLDVVNNVEVLPHGQRTDTDIAADVRAALERYVRIPADEVQTTVSHGLLTLQGELESYRQRLDVEAAVRYVKGVVGIVNNLTVRRNTVTTKEIREAIDEALERQAVREAERVQVLVDDGVVTLRGHVRSWREKRAILGTAGHAPGVTMLVDELRVTPFS